MHIRVGQELYDRDSTMQRMLMILVIALSAGTANASLLKYDLEAAIVEPFASNWTGPGALPGPVASPRRYVWGRPEWPAIAARGLGPGRLFHS